MTTTPAAAMASKRRRKTRTKNVNSRPPVIASKLKVTEIDLALGREHLVCPDCSTWVPITGMLGTPKLVPHHTDRAKTADPRRCTAGSNRQVTIDVEADALRTQLIEGTPTAASRRATKVLPKPTVQPAPAASQIKTVPLDAEQVSRTLRQHQQRCLACKGKAENADGQTLPCPDGERLAATRDRLLRQEPKRQAGRDFFARERRRFDRQYAAAAPAKRTSEWAAVQGKVSDVDAARKLLPRGDRPADGPSLPEEPENLERHNQRQAELGRQYAARKSQAPTAA
ncbi:hypothetical protein OHA84_37740 (plasmid) [Streptomyces sp. NBC_00513]|uniref:hypothetical protein n=1 Tax=unclassified Streptomyces TaxID=2593676 RepID=UPI0022552827|nr:MULTISPECIES: hypothetical protein [unclassified Streptomyces]MCX5078805.1 hypothetical protein [Streptomyces sp. NBC_00424]WUD46275.1 hypothetical protein OHA84_37740 [Streptomyces sp. NBC_00513]